MNTKADTAFSPPPSMEAAAESERLNQRTRNLRAFQEKYDTMLYIIEFIAKYQQSHPLAQNRDKKFAELQSLALRARQELRELTPHSG